MRKKKVYINYKCDRITFVADRPNGNAGSGEHVIINPGDVVDWRARNVDVDLKPFEGFTVEFTSTTPTNGKSRYDSSTAADGHARESDPADRNLGSHKYRVTLFGAGNPTTDPEVEVVDPGIGQYFVTLEAVYDAVQSTLVCQSDEVYEGDLVRVTLALGELRIEPFTVSFLQAMPVYLPTGKGKALRSTPGENATFYCQVQPVQHTMEFVYQVDIPEMGVTGQGVITVRPRPEPGSASA